MTVVVSAGLTSAVAVEFDEVALTLKSGKLLPAFTEAAPSVVKVTVPVEASIA